MRAPFERNGNERIVRGSFAESSRGDQTKGGVPEVRLLSRTSKENYPATFLRRASFPATKSLAPSTLRPLRTFLSKRNKNTPPTLSVCSSRNINKNIKCLLYFFVSKRDKSNTLAINNAKFNLRLAKPAGLVTFVFVSFFFFFFLYVLSTRTRSAYNKLQCNLK